MRKVIMIATAAIVFAAAVVFFKGSSLSEDTIKDADNVNNTVMAVSIEPSDEGSIVYRNRQFGFELVLQNGYAGYQASIKEFKYNTRICLSVDARGTNWTSDNFTVFCLLAYKSNWWALNADINDNGGAFLKGEVQTSSTYLGEFIDKNNEYAFAAVAGQDCPRSLTGKSSEGYDTPQCKLFLGIVDTLSTFKFIN